MFRAVPTYSSNCQFDQAAHENIPQMSHKTLEF